MNARIRPKDVQDIIDAISGHGLIAYASTLWVITGRAHHQDVGPTVTATPRIGRDAWAVTLHSPGKDPIELTRVQTHLVPGIAVRHLTGWRLMIDMEAASDEYSRLGREIWEARNHTTPRPSGDVASLVAAYAASGLAYEAAEEAYEAWEARTPS